MEIMDRERHIKKELREYWFKDHVAELSECGDLTILDWRNPKGILYYTRYIFDGSRMYVTGDIGEAVFCLTWKAGVHAFNDITNIHYFIEKIQAYHSKKYDYDGDVAARILGEWKVELLEDREFEDQMDKEEFMDDINCLINDAKNCSSKEEWAYQYVNDEHEDFISREDLDYWEWIYDIGDVPSLRIYGYLVGLQMASEQLSKK